jgi:hypothetical protein
MTAAAFHASTHLEQRGVIVRASATTASHGAVLYADEVQHESPDIDAVAGRMAGTDER